VSKPFDVAQYYITIPFLYNLYPNNCSTIQYKNIYTIAQHNWYMFRPFCGHHLGGVRQGKQKMQLWLIIIWTCSCSAKLCVLFFSSITPLMMTENRPKQLWGLLNDCIYFCMEILCNCWNRRCKIFLLHWEQIILSLLYYFFYFKLYTVHFCSVFTNKPTNALFWQFIVPLLHVSTYVRHHQGAFFYLMSYIKNTCRFMVYAKVFTSSGCG
jgi:hypothetical protein